MFFTDIFTLSQEFLINCQIFTGLLVRDGHVPVHRHRGVPHRMEGSLLHLGAQEAARVQRQALQVRVPGKTQGNFPVGRKREALGGGRLVCFYLVKKF